MHFNNVQQQSIRQSQSPQIFYLQNQQHSQYLHAPPKSQTPTSSIMSSSSITGSTRPPCIIGSSTSVQPQTQHQFTQNLTQNSNIFLQI